MNWPDLSEWWSRVEAFVRMGGYGFYVWGSYLFALAAIVWELISLRQRKHAVLREEKSPAVRPIVLRGSTNETTS
jgi:heme exporter protein D